MLTRRLADCPPEFLGESGAEAVVPAAVVSDLLSALGGTPLTDGEASAYAPGRKGVEPGVRLALLASWLLHDEWFRRAGNLGPAACRFLADLAVGALRPLSQAVEPRRFVTEPDRREELARLTLKALGLVPRGENAIQAKDRLSALDTLETERTAAASRKAQERARRVLEEMKKKAAQEAAAKASRE